MVTNRTNVIDLFYRKDVYSFIFSSSSCSYTVACAHTHIYTFIYVYVGGDCCEVVGTDESPRLLS